MSQPTPPQLRCPACGGPHLPLMCKTAGTQADSDLAALADDILDALHPEPRNFYDPGNVPDDGWRDTARDAVVAVLTRHPRRHGGTRAIDGAPRESLALAIFEAEDEGNPLADSWEVTTPGIRQIYLNRAAAALRWMAGLRWQAGGCTCSYTGEYRGGGYTEIVAEYDPSCPEHSEHLYDPRIGQWVQRVDVGQTRRDALNEAANWLDEQYGSAGTPRESRTGAEALAEAMLDALRMRAIEVGA